MLNKILFALGLKKKMWRHKISAVLTVEYSDSRPRMYDVFLTMKSTTEVPDLSIVRARCIERALADGFICNDEQVVNLSSSRGFSIDDLKVVVSTGI